MTEKWLIEDINRLLQHRKRVVLLDPNGQCGFALPILEQHQITILRTNEATLPKWKQEKEELMLRYDAEVKYADRPLVFYVTRPQTSLTFLYDYCFTHGCLDLTYPQDWLKNKIYSNTGLQAQLEDSLLLTAAKKGIGEDIEWWKKIVLEIEGVINLDNELLPFVHAPEEYFKGKTSDVKLLFEQKVHDVLAQPYTPKPPKTLAGEVVKSMLEGLAYNTISPTLLSLYHKWADSTTYRPSLDVYCSDYKLKSSASPMSAHPDHCFDKLDRLALKHIVENSRDTSFVKSELQKLKKRIFSSKVPHYVPSWWRDVWTLYHSSTTRLTACRNLDAFIEYYTGTFSEVDRAIRNLYEVFLNDRAIVRPLQEYYESLNHELLQTWFGFSGEYTSDQQGTLPALLKDAPPKTAIIVGDGVRYEIADYVAKKLEMKYTVEKRSMLADMPSETEHNMSALYVGNNEVVKVHKDREVRLTQTTGKNIVYMPLEHVNDGTDAEYLVLTYKDIDSAGEKLQQAAIKLFSEFEAVLIDKITLLLNNGYREVYLVTDHGFVLTGLLDDSDKIEPNATGKKEVHERFIRTVDKQSNGEWLAFDAPYNDYNYVYAAKNHRPFKSKGVYGFSHGGFTPQEIIIPQFKFTMNKSTVSELEVIIANKDDLNDVTGELFVIKLAVPKVGSDLFGSIRKVQIKLYTDNKEFQSSDIITMSADSIEKEFSFSGNSQVQAILIDAATKAQLDSVFIKKSTMRDLGGLL